MATLTRQGRTLTDNYETHPEQMYKQKWGNPDKHAAHLLNLKIIKLLSMYK